VARREKGLLSSEPGIGVRMVALRRLPVLRISHVKGEGGKEEVVAVGKGHVVTGKDSKAVQRAYRAKYGPVQKVVEDPRPKPLARVLERLLTADDSN
jgi:hypothetical protein